MIILRSIFEISIDKSGHTIANDDMSKIGPNKIYTSGNLTTSLCSDTFAQRVDEEIDMDLEKRDTINAKQQPITIFIGNIDEACDYADIENLVN